MNGEKTNHIPQTPEITHGTVPGCITVMIGGERETFAGEADDQLATLAADGPRRWAGTQLRVTNPGTVTADAILAEHGKAIASAFERALEDVEHPMDQDVAHIVVRELDGTGGEGTTPYAVRITNAGEGGEIHRVDLIDLTYPRFQGNPPRAREIWLHQAHNDWHAIQHGRFGIDPARNPHAKRNAHGLRAHVPCGPEEARNVARLIAHAIARLHRPNVAGDLA